MADYNSFDINTVGTVAPWGAREEQCIKDIIDTLVGDSVSGAKNTGGHEHNKLYSASGVAALEILSNGKVGINNSAPGTQFEVSDNNEHAISTLSCFSTTAGHGSIMSLGKSASATIGTLAETANDGALAYINAFGVDSSSAKRTAASIYFEQDSASTATRVPGRIILATTDATNEVVERMRIDSSGNVGIGTDTFDGKLDIASSGANAINAFSYSSTDTITSSLNFIKSSSSTVNTKLVTADGEALGNIEAIGMNSSNANSSAASILFEQEGAAGSVCPGRIVFKTAYSGALSERIRIDSTGNIGVNTTSPFEVASYTYTGGKHINLVSTGSARLSLQGDSAAINFVDTTAAADDKWASLGVDSGIFKLFSANDDSTSRVANIIVADLGTGNVGIGDAAPTALLDVNSNILRLRTSNTPASAAATGNAGSICWDADYIYICTATDTWKRAAIATW